MVAAGDSPTGFRRIFGDVAGFATSQYFQRFTTLIKGFVVARLLGPAGNGLWQHFVIISEYCQFAHLGTLQGLNKVIGHRIGRDDEEGTRAAQDTGTGAVLVSAVVLWAALCAWVGLSWDELSPWDRWGLPILGLIVVADQLNFVYMTLLRAHSRIRMISTFTAIFALSNLAVSLSLLPKFRVLGLLIGWLITRAITTVWMMRRSGYSFRPRIRLDELRILLMTGFPIYLFHLTRVGLRNIDRVLVDGVLDKSQLGIYGIAVTLAGLVHYAADAVSFVIYPIFLRQFGDTGDPTALRVQLTRPTEFLSLFVSMALGLAFLMLHLPILWLLPEYLESIPIYRMLSVSVAFQCLAILPGFYLMAINRQNWLVPIGLAAIAFDYFVGREMIARDFGLAGVAGTMGVGSFAYATAVMLYAGSFAWRSPVRALLWIAKVYVPVAYVAGVIAGLRWGVPRTPLAETSELARATVEGLIFLAVSLPLLLLFEKRHGVIRRLRSGPEKPGRPRE